MAISTYKAFLMKGTGSGTVTYSKLIDIKDFPDLGGSPDALETTTLSDGAQTYIPGIQSTEALEFTANYSATDYQTLKELTGTKTPFAVWFGATVSSGVVTPTGSDGKFAFEGYLDVHISGGGVNEVVDMVITIIPASTIEFSIPNG
jgi:hypothetical protein